MSSVSAKPIRGKLADLIQVALPDALVYRYAKSDFQSAAPVVTITSTAIDRSQDSAMGGCTRKSAFGLTVNVFAPYPTQSMDGAWSEEDTEDQADEIETLVADVVRSNRNVSGFWKHIKHSAPNQITYPVISGRAYRHITIPVIAEVFNE